MTPASTSSRADSICLAKNGVVEKTNGTIEPAKPSVVPTIILVRVIGKIGI